MTDASVPPVRRMCTVCQEHKPLESFPSRHDGARRHQCHLCLAAYARERYRQNPAKKRANAKKWADNNPGKVCVRALRWQRKNPDKARAALQRYHAQKYKPAINDFTATEWREMKEAYAHRCVYCHKRCEGKLTQDHIIPLSKGGNHTKSNIVPACQSCNSKKGTRAPLVPVQPLLI